MGDMRRQQEPTRTVTLAGQTFDNVPISMRDGELAALLVEQGQLASIDEAFPSINLDDYVREGRADIAEQFNAVERFSIGARGAVADLALGIEDMLGIETERGAEIRREQRTRAELEAEGVDLGDAASLGDLVPNLALGRLRRFFPVVGAEAAIEGLQGAEGERLQAGAQGAVDASVGFGIGKFVFGPAIEAGMNAGQAVFNRARSALAARRGQTGDIVISMADEIAQEGARVRPAETFDERLGRLRPDDVALGASVSQGGRRSEMVRELDRLGFPLSPGQRSGNASRRQLEAGLASTPVTGQPFAELAEQQAITTSRLLAQGIGAQSDAITPAVIADSYARLGGEFQQIARELGNDVFQRGDFPRFMNALEAAKRIEVQDIRNVGLEDVLPAERIIRNMQQAAGDGVDGRQLMAWRSALTDEIQTLSSGRGDAARGSTVFALSDAVDAIDELIVGATRGSETAGRYADARTQYRLLAAIAKTQAIDQLGEIRPRSLANVLAREYPLEFRRGGLTGFAPGRSRALQSVADAFDAVRGLSTIAPDIVANSGTPTRIFVQNLAMGDLAPAGLTQLALRSSIGNSVADAALTAPSFGAGSEAVRRLVPRTSAAVGAATGVSGDLLEDALQTLYEEESVNSE